MKKHQNLYAPSLYWNIKTKKSLNYINGCGGQGVTTLLVPDNLVGLDISAACDIHDYMYEQGKDKKIADRIFLKNMLSLVDEEQDSIILKSLRKIKAHIYYFGVKLFGKFFFKNKN